MTPKISVIIPLYNRFHLLPHVVESILAQTLPVLEVILIDDGSTEHSPDMVESYIQERPSWRQRVRYRYQENQGQSAANNVGIAMARGEWLAFNGNDDLWLPQKLEWQFRALEKFKGQSDVCFTDAWFMNNPYMKMTVFQFAGKNFRQAPEQLSEEIGLLNEPCGLLVHHQPVWLQTVVARASFVRHIGGLDPYLRFSEDYDLAFRMGLETKFTYVSTPLVLIDRTPSDIRHRGAAENWKRKDFKLTMDGRRLERQLSLSEGLSSPIRQAIRENLRSHHSKWCNWYLSQRNYPKALAAISTAAKYSLTISTAFKWLLTRLSPALARYLLSIRDHKDARVYYGLNW